MRANAHVATLGLAVCTVMLQQITCNENPPCPIVSQDALWQQVSLSVDVTTPGKCPISVARSFAGTLQQLTGFVEGTSQYIVQRGDPNQSLLIVFMRAPNGVYVNASGIPDDYTFFGATNPIAQPNLFYYAGTVGIPVGSSELGQDLAEFAVGIRNGSIAVSRVAITYNHNVLSVLGGPGSVAQYSTFTVTSSLSNYTSPVTRKWYRNGVLLPNTGTSLTDSRNTTGSYSYRLDVTDADGDKGSATKTISVGTPGGGSPPTPPPCGGSPPPVPLRAPAESPAEAVPGASPVAMVPPTVAPRMLPCQ